MFNYKYLTRDHLKGFDNYKVRLIRWSISLYLRQIQRMKLSIEWMVFYKYISANVSDNYTELILIQRHSAQSDNIVYGPASQSKLFYFFLRYVIFTDMSIILCYFIFIKLIIISSCFFFIPFKTCTFVTS